MAVSSGGARANNIHRAKRAAVLIVDSDLSFAFWLGHALDQAGYVSLPAQSTGAAAELLRINDVGVDVVLVDATLAGASTFVTHLRRSYTHIKAVAMLPEDGITVPAILFDANRRKADRRDMPAAAEWVALIEAMSPRANSTFTGVWRRVGTVR